MKFIGMTIIMMSSTGLGIYLFINLKSKLKICCELLNLCDELIIDLNYSVTPITELITNIVSAHKHLSFISADFVQRKIKCNSILSNDENKEISKFVYSLGKSDINSQIKIIQGFKEYIYNCKDKYSYELKRNGKIYVTFGFLGGIFAALALA